MRCIIFKCALHCQKILCFPEIVENPFIPPTTKKPPKSKPPEPDSDGDGDGISAPIIAVIISVVVIIVLIIGAVFLALGLYICQVQRQKKTIRHKYNTYTLTLHGIYNVATS